MYHCLVGFISRNNTYDNKGAWGCVKKMELYSPKIFISWCVKESTWSATLLILNRLWQISIDTIKPKSSIKIIVISRGSAEAITWFLQNVKLRLTHIILFYNISVPSEAQCGLFPAPSSYELGEAHQKPTHLRGAEKLQGLPDSAHTATDVEGLKGEWVDGYKLSKDGSGSFSPWASSLTICRVHPPI